MDEGGIIYFDEPRKILEEDVLMYGVSVPRVVEVVREMRKIGGCIPFKDIPLSVDEFIMGLRGVLR